MLLLHHPDKNTGPHIQSVDVTLIKEAYEILSQESSRKNYDAQLKVRPSGGPRPAEMVSLDVFVEDDQDSWSHSCRCGGQYKITEKQMECDEHLIGCTNCSETIWVGYELAEE
ncbi:hypothetical protein BDZ89DRAFT_1018791 [Hymenopellis radicata]|nr:hypothetical protein BDZ89DRAFT_1018791 [Hymenopellis radicata]